VKYHDGKNTIEQVPSNRYLQVQVSNEVASVEKVGVQNHSCHESFSNDFLENDGPSIENPQDKPKEQDNQSRNQDCHHLGEWILVEVHEKVGYDKLYKFENIRFPNLLDIIGLRNQNSPPFGVISLTIGKSTEHSIYFLLVSKPFFEEK
jgi:hypothetical protein